VPGQVQPVAPGTLAAPRIPQLTLDPSMPEVQKVEYLSNGHIEVAGAVVTLEQPEQSRARAMAGAVARRVLAARAQLDEVDVSVYDKGTYGGFGGPSPLLTASVPRDRLNDFLAWTAGQGTYERAWVSTTPATPPLREPDRVRELTVNFLGSVADKAADAVHHTTAKVLGGVQGGGGAAREERDGQGEEEGAGTQDRSEHEATIKTACPSNVTDTALARFHEAGGYSRPCRRAFTAACVRSFAWSFSRISPMCFFTRPTLMSSAAAISLLPQPSATRRRIAVSRSVRGDRAELPCTVCSRCFALSGSKNTAHVAAARTAWKSTSGGADFRQYATAPEASAAKI